jgi:hypothetical protein
MDDPRAPSDQRRPHLRLIRGGRTVFGGRTAVFGKWVPRIIVRMRSRHYDSLLVAGACVHPGTALEWHAKRITESGERNAIGMMLFKISSRCSRGERNILVDAGAPREERLRRPTSH